MIDKEKFYWACRKYGLYKLADALGLCHTAMGRKMHNPTEKFYVDEYVSICRILHPHLSTPNAINQYLT